MTNSSNLSRLSKTRKRRSSTGSVDELLSSNQNRRRNLVDNQDAEVRSPATDALPVSNGDGGGQDDGAIVKRKRRNTITSTSIDTPNPVDNTPRPTRDRRGSTTELIDRRRQQNQQQNQDATLESRTTDALPNRPIPQQTDTTAATDVDTTIPTRRRALSDFSDLVDSGDIITDPRSRRERSASVGANDVSQKRFSRSELQNLVSSLDQINLAELAVVQKHQLLDNSLDQDDVFVEEDLTATEDNIDISLRSSQYNQDEASWQPLPQAAAKALEDVAIAFQSANPTGFGPDGYLMELLPNIFATNGTGGVSRERLNDVYFLAMDKIDQIDNNPLLRNADKELDPTLVSEAEIDRLEKLKLLVAAINDLPDKNAFLNANEARLYTASKLETTNLGDNSLSDYERFVAETYGIGFDNISFNRVYDNVEAHKAIAGYRGAVMDRLQTDLEGIDKLFGDKTLKKKKHYAVQKAEKALQKAVRRAREITNQTSSDETRAILLQLELALTVMVDSAEFYVDTSKHKQRIKACQDVMSRIDELVVSDGRIITAHLEKSFSTIESAFQTLAKVSPEAARTFQEDMETLFFNASPEATYQTATMDSLGVALGLAEIDSSAADTQTFRNASEISTGLGITSTGSALLMDLYKAYSFIADIKKLRRNNEAISKTQLLDGAVTTTNLAKNASTAISTGLELTGATGATASAVGSVTGSVAVGASIALGAGFTVHGGLVAYKTNARISSVQGISDAKIREQVLARVKSKRRRALLEAVGGTLAVVGGVLVVVGTAGIAAPAVIAGAGTVIALGLAGNRGVNYAQKVSDGTLGEARQSLAVSIFEHMNALLAAGEYQKAKELAQALTNNKYKQNLMLRGADAAASEEDQQAALIIMREKLKTW